MKFQPFHRVYARSETYTEFRDFPPTHLSLHQTWINILHLAFQAMTGAMKLKTILSSILWTTGVFFMNIISENVISKQVLKKSIQIQISSHAEFNSPGIPAYWHTARQDDFTKSCLTRSLPEERGWDCHRWPLFHIGCLPTITAIQIAAHSPSSLLPDYQLERQFDRREY